MKKTKGTLFSQTLKVEGNKVPLIAKLSPAQSNSNSVGWAEIALISTFTHPPTPPLSGRVPKRQLQYGYWPNLEGRFVGPSLTDY